MDRGNIVIEIDAEISRLQQARALLTGTNAGKPKPRASASASLRNNKPVHTLSAAARARISAAQKARWAKSKSAAKKEASNAAAAAAATAKKGTPNGPVRKNASAKKAVSVKKVPQPQTRVRVTPAS
jgi:hypothetical protein